jgi:tyrosyl-tRNA synthetase
MSLSQVLQERGYINQFSAETLAEILDGEPRTVYLGVDPSSDSMTVGNLVAVLLLRALAKAGHKVIFLAGGGTGMIGDPKPNVERPLLPRETIIANVEQIRAQAERLLQVPNLTMADNYDWLGKLGLIEFLRDIGKHFTANGLVKKDAIAARMDSEDGITYTEFSYPLLQAYDYYHLHTAHGCDVQIGGSDQWGNIIAGVDLIRRKTGATTYALTIPLVIDKVTGKKFGKSEGNAVWLDAGKTSPFQFYQFWLNASDEGVEEYLKLYTEISLSDIREIMRLHTETPGERGAQRSLAYAATEIVHGTHMAQLAEDTTKVLFGGGDISAISDVAGFVQNAPTTQVAPGEELIEVLVKSALAASKREARQFVETGAITMNNAERITDPKRVLHENDFFKNGLALLKRGKQKVAVLQSVTGEPTK